MTLPTFKKKAQKPWLDLAIFAAVFVFVGFSVHMLFGFVRRGEGNLTKATLPVRETLPLDTGSAARKLASPSRAKVEGASTEVLRIPCLSQLTQRKLTSGARLVQLHAPACDEDLKSPSTWTGTNESSGEEIVVFVNPKEKTLSTSYFSLQEGVNRLVFTQEGAKGLKHLKAGRRVESLEVRKP